MNLETTRLKVAEALTCLKQGNPHAASELLAPLIFNGTLAGDCAAKAQNWIDLGFATLARTELEGYLRKTALTKCLEAVR